MGKDYCVLIAIISYKDKYGYESNGALVVFTLENYKYMGHGVIILLSHVLKVRIL